MLELAAEHGAPKGTDAELFQAFLTSVAPQVRSAFMARHPLHRVFDVLSEVFEAIQIREDDTPKVRVRAGDTGTSVITQMPDQPFVVDTLLLGLKTEEVGYLAGFNMVVGVRRDESGNLIGVDGTGDPLESIIFVESEAIDPDESTQKEVALSGRLRLAQATVADFHNITDRVEKAANRFTRAADEQPDAADTYREAAAFLRWLLADNFIFMAGIDGRVRLGTARKATAKLLGDGVLAPWEGGTSQSILIRKNSYESRVHRAGRSDEIRIEVPGEKQPLFLQGLFTYRGVTQASRQVPLLRQRLSRVLRTQDSKPGSYRYNGISNVFDSLPTEYLFTAEPSEIAEMIERVLEAEQEQRARVHVLQKPEDSTTFVLAAMPRGRWSEELREGIEELLVAETGASYCDHGVFIGRYDTMLVHYYLTGTESLDDPRIERLMAEVRELTATWQDQVLSALGSRYDSPQAEALATKYGQAFEKLYIRMTPTDQTVRDIELLEALTEDNPVLADLFVDDKGRANLRVYQLQNILLSEMLPILDNFGLVVIDQYMDPVTPRRDAERAIDTFRLQGVRDFEDAEVLEYTADLIDGLEAVFTQRTTDGPLNHLLPAARIPWQAVDLIRAYLGYARQLGLRYTRDRTREILLSQPDLVAYLWRYFHTRFDPQLTGERDRAIADSAETFQDELRKVSNHDTDVVFRTLFNLMESTLRTNFYRRDRTEHYISFKIDCATVWQMPEPRMQYEIYVHHREMEGIHLRGGPIARGGIRWSDREDYRREIHGLATTQMVKNVLIVPEGAKGGFFLKHASSDRAQRRQDADRLYQILVRGLLDLTDNYVGDKVTHPPNVVRHDGNDPYLVVAADKGTAHLSDTANGVAREYGFWLDDAFASGGSNGYDHKKVGITARGAWMTARIHFAELGLNPMKQPFSCVAIGDPGGDVFGNGVIESPHMKLVAAFNHMHVFLDPNPDPKRSYKERLRMFKAVQGWDQYNTDLLSEGGGIFSRQAKSIPLSPQVKDLLGVMSDDLPVDAVIRLILRLEVDLWWNGGIGTYVKASSENHTDVGDTANDAVRISAKELRARIVAEGGNLGLTQAARVEFAQRGGRINTDAIDNSGGVDMSDHEVNLKILLSPLLESEELTMEARNTLLEKMTVEVADEVLANSDAHGKQLSLDQIRSAQDPLFFSRTIEWVCRKSGTSRSMLTLPSDDDLARRVQNRQGLTRPELAVLQAHVKMHVFKDLVRSEGSEIPEFQDRVRSYFPKVIQSRYPEAIDDHMLHRSIGMTTLLSEVVGNAGVLFFPMLQEWTGASSVAIARAWVCTMKAIKAEQIQRELKECGAGLEARYKAWIEVQNGVTGLLAKALSPGQAGLVGEPMDTVREVLKLLPKIKGAAHQDQLRIAAEQHTAREIPENLALRIATLSKLTVAREVALLHDPEQRLSHTVIRYISIGEATGILPALRQMRIRQTSGPWDQVALAILRNRMFMLMRELYRVVPIGPEVRLGVNRVRRRLVRRGPLGNMAREMQEVLGKHADIATLLVAEERIRAHLAQGALALPEPTKATTTGATNGRGSRKAASGSPGKGRSKSKSKSKSKGRAAKSSP
jgi:glutamate dehydrogenase